MHELSLLADLLRKIESVARREQANVVTRVAVRIGALCHLSSSHLREHFARAAQGTVAAGAHLDITVLTDVADPHAQELVLESVEVTDVDDNDSDKARVVQ
jgi:hydrogenase nickel incorporation protein HypA/HybF